MLRIKILNESSTIDEYPGVGCVVEDKCNEFEDPWEVPDLACVLIS